MCVFVVRRGEAPRGIEEDVPHTRSLVDVKEDASLVNAIYMGYRSLRSAWAIDHCDLHGLYTTAICMGYRSLRSAWAIYHCDLHGLKIIAICMGYRL